MTKTATKEKLLVRQYRHEDAALWPLIGPHLTNREFVKVMGGPIYSDATTVWWVALRGGAVTGFASLRDAKDGYWLDSDYVVPDERGDQIHATLSAERDKHLDGLPPRTVKVCCRMARWSHYEKRGYHQDRIRGDWVYGSKRSAKESK